MELDKHQNDSTSQSNFLSKLNIQGKDHILSDISEDFLMALIYISLFMFTCYILLSMSYYLSVNKKKKDMYDSIGAVYFDQKLIKKSEELKRYAWENWMARLELDWKHFDNSIKSKKEKWLEERVHSWEEWLKQIEDKWEHYNAHMDMSYKFYIFKISSAWNQSHWEQWAKAELKYFIDREWHNWVYQNEQHLNNWITNEWSEWKNHIIAAWLTKNWKLSENAYWEKMAKKKWVKSLFRVVRKNWLKWKERIDREFQQWDEWVVGKQHLYTNNHEWDAWVKWKTDKYALVKEVRKSFVTKWVTEKQWRAWVEERHNLIQQEKYRMGIWGDPQMGRTVPTWGGGPSTV
ncbi:tryptophan-rich antigen [Plasmodium vivax]|uniref:Tryptophan-rich antigen (Pv-fam-a) n=7 Tax=Plasmodium vivax TaxID=5855 RepID=A5K682_PLAVS|nr:tryptophan-rich antigen (Pv-fam-a) [Plasmodium vivax]KMZ81777.1 tryptophan-rich antigen (Pv-fam-a) [Plasmodium vivax India VII]KMZ87930.1 tryptophan-rich antigen (Pv-fam-a) [Plasmodium vivax Brazil I]KMZ94338.1 tryptophan-rich antigen (Pv-fam-a) [Plasmodium vivax Mauritania I]KNA00958.1 tryptophan-rich antigen (Pv-fam-a) [Plasmodium vivax North Korean]EDL45417.1 tryptophan-rich antigen (Pv-fam-a) [Plasmodium vivax]|eukprot:XP_001615144.1 tryptophan-rich antigen (Pv-fam-a) [Plasmodium vivax Sal-1]